MTVKTGGPIRGFVGRWLMRLEASGQMISIAAQVTTAGSAVSGVLLFGTDVPTWAVITLLLGSIVSGFAFTFIYVEWGIYNRKNRENKVRGNNFSKPQNAIDDAILARSILSGELGRELTDEEREIINREAFAGYLDFKDGIPTEEWD